MVTSTSHMATSMVVNTANARTHQLKKIIQYFFATEAQRTQSFTECICGLEHCSPDGMKWNPGCAYLFPDSALLHPGYKAF